MVNTKQDTSVLVDNILSVVQTHFPGSCSSTDILDKVTKVIEKHGLNNKNTLFAQSVCPDEINHEPGDITNIFAEYLGKVFHLGGLGGIPFTGQTGFAAYSQHVPEDSHCFILMAPHIGLDSALNLGKYDREGQISSGAACGAAIGALCHCEASKPLPNLMSVDDDYQMSYIIHKLNEAEGTLLAEEDANSRQALLAAQMHEIATAMLNKIVTLDFGGPNSTLTILTGIQINMPDPLEDYFQPLSFYTKDKVQGDIDLFEEAFGMRSPKREVVPVTSMRREVNNYDSSASNSTSWFLRKMFFYPLACIGLR